MLDQVLTLLPFDIDPSIYIELALLFGISAQFKAMDGINFLTELTAKMAKRFDLLYSVVLITVLFSPFILNDVLILILTPVLIKYSKDSGRNIAPLAVAMVSFTNIASSLTPIGNPQNILLWQATGITAVQFVQGTWLPLTISGLIATGCLYPLTRNLAYGNVKEPTYPVSHTPASYLISVAIIIFSLDFFGLSKTIVLGLAFLLGFLFTYKTIWRIGMHYDLRSLLILYALVSIVAILGFIIRPLLGPIALDASAGVQPYSGLFMAILSNIISNVPATQLILSLGNVTMNSAPRIAVAAGLAGNTGPIGSFANILALLMIRHSGLSIRRTIWLQFVIGTISFVPALIL